MNQLLQEGPPPLRVARVDFAESLQDRDAELDLSLFLRTTKDSFSGVDVNLWPEKKSYLNQMTSSCLDIKKQRQHFIESRWYMRKNYHHTEKTCLRSIILNFKHCTVIFCLVCKQNRDWINLVVKARDFANVVQRRPKLRKMQNWLTNLLTACIIYGLKGWWIQVADPLLVVLIGNYLAWYS